MILAFAYFVTETETLEIEKERLKEEIKKFRNEREDIDLDAPIQKVITILQTIGNDFRKSFLVTTSLFSFLEFVSMYRRNGPRNPRTVTICCQGTVFKQALLARLEARGKGTRLLCKVVLTLHSHRA